LLDSAGEEGFALDAEQAFRCFICFPDGEDFQWRGGVRGGERGEGLGGDLGGGFGHTVAGEDGPASVAGGLAGFCLEFSASDYYGD